MRLSKLERLIEQAEAEAARRRTEQAQLSGYVKIAGSWVQPWDFVAPDDKITWARAVHEASKTGDCDEMQRLAEVGTRLHEEGIRRAERQMRDRS